ncbi:MAG: hypothetical protein V1861_04000 [Candidatus Micrarchaeota archaeon]
MQLGFRKHPDARKEIQILQNEETSRPCPLKYRPPLIYSAKFGQPLLDSNAGRFHGREGGTFEVKATGDCVKAYAMLWIYNDPSLMGIDAFHHRHVCQILKKLLHMRREFGRVVLGGGYMLADFDKRILMVFGQSGDYGRVPDFMQFGLFQRSGYLVHIAGFGSPAASTGASNHVTARDWYLSHGIDVDT